MVELDSWIEIFRLFMEYQRGEVVMEERATAVFAAGAPICEKLQIVFLFLEIRKK